MQQVQTVITCWDGSSEKYIIINDHPRVNISNSCGDTHLVGVRIRWPFLLFSVFVPVVFFLCGVP